MNLTSHSRRPTGCVNVELTGELDLTTNEQTRDVLRRALGLATTAIEVNLDQVLMLDCSTLGIILSAQCDAARRGVMLTVSNPHGIVRRVLQLTETLALLTAQPAPTIGSQRTDATRPSRPLVSRRPQHSPDIRRPDAVGPGRLDTW